MRYPLIVIPGEPSKGVKSLPSFLQEVPCPCCLKPMILSIKKLTTIFLHYFIDDKNEEMDVMCLECIENEELDNKDVPRIHKKVRILSID